MSGTDENVSPQVIRQVAKEIGKLVSKPVEGIKIHVNDADITDIQATIEGPEGTPYHGGQFRVKIVLGESYPTGPPKGFFVTKIFHPNVAKNGSICVNTLKKDWQPSMGIAHVLTVIKCLLIHPNPASALNEEAGKLLLEQYDEFAKHAIMMTEVHARAKASTGDMDGAKRPTDGSNPVAKKIKEKGAEKKKEKKKALKRL
jgi:ubiquitin-conjugating enzyme E2 S